MSEDIKVLKKKTDTKDKTLFELMSEWAQSSKKKKIIEQQNHHKNEYYQLMNKNNGRYLTIITIIHSS